MQSLWARLGIVSFTAAACLTIFPAAAQTGGWVDPPDEIETPAPRVIPIPPPTSQERSEPAPRATPPPPREAAPAPPPNTHEIAPIPRQAAPREATPTPREAAPRQVAPPPREAAPAPREAAPPPREAAPREVAPAPGVREATPRRAEPPAARAERRPAPPRTASRPRPERTARSPAPSAADIELVLEAERLTLDYLDAWSGPNPYALAQMPDFYGPQVVFHGRRMSIRALMDEKRRFASRWPLRDYRPVPESFRADCAARAAFCKVRVLAEFDAADPRRGRRSRGVLTLELDVRVTPDGPLIVAENSRVMDRGPRARGN